MRTGSELVAESLGVARARFVFHTEGGAIRPLLDSLNGNTQGIRPVRCGSDALASCMAAAHAKLTGQPGFCLAEEGAGVLAGIREAGLAAVPLVTISVSPRASDAPPEGDGGLLKACGALGKWCAEAPSAGRVPGLMNRALRTALSGRPGPVTLGLEAPLLAEEAAVPAARPAKPASPAVSLAAVEGVRQMLSRARRPLLLLGGPLSRAAGEALSRFARVNNLPVVLESRWPDSHDADEENHVGHTEPDVSPHIARLFAECDLLIAVGVALDESATSGHMLVEPPWAHCKLVQVHADLAEFCGAFAPDLPINARVSDFAAQLGSLDPVDHSAWDGWVRDARRDWAGRRKEPDDGALTLARAVTAVSSILPADAILSCDTPEQMEAIRRHHRFPRPGTALMPACPTPGYGIAAGLAAAVTFPDRVVAAFTDPFSCRLARDDLARLPGRGGRLLAIVALSPGQVCDNTEGWPTVTDVPGLEEAVTAAAESSGAASSIRVVCDPGRQAA